MEKCLVSIVTPCYNTANYIHRLLDSILQQTYPNIEMIVVNDGSTDNSIDVINSYKPKFEAKGYSFTIITQENSGQSVAIREGMKLIKGKYFVWPDSDDFYATPTAIEKMVSTLESLGDDYGMIRSQGNLLEDNTLKIIGSIGQKSQVEYDKRVLFEDCLLERNNFFFLAGAYVANFAKMKLAMSLDIYTEKNAGQNWQLMLPVLYHYKCFTVKEQLYNVLARSSSHSRGQFDGYEKTLTKYVTYEQTILETLKRIKGLPQEEFTRYSKEVRQNFCLKRLYLSYTHQQRADFINFYTECKNLCCIGKHETVLRALISFPIISKGISIIRRHLHKFK